MPSAKNTIWMVTENRHKFGEARTILEQYGITVRQEKMAKAEIQSDSLRKIAIHALGELPEAKRRWRNLFVEDSGLFVESLRGFPGAYSSYVYGTLGTHGVLELLGSTRRRRAYFESAVALTTPGVPSLLFTGRIRGRIATEARGDSGFGFDPIFIPDGSRLTHAEMGGNLKNRQSHRAVALRHMATWLCRTS